jgi:hypothetical protein
MVTNVNLEAGHSRRATKLAIDISLDKAVIRTGVPDARKAQARFFKN